jgi:hypothetical protein
MVLPHGVVHDAPAVAHDNISHQDARRETMRIAPRTVRGLPELCDPPIRDTLLELPIAFLQLLS